MTPRAAQVRFYVDADILGLGKILGALRNDVTYPGDPGAVLHKRHRAPCPIASPDVLDTDWIPDVAARGWLIVTRDSMIIQNRNEIAAIRENNAKMVLDTPEHRVADCPVHDRRRRPLDGVHRHGHRRQRASGDGRVKSTSQRSPRVRWSSRNASRRAAGHAAKDPRPL